MNVNWCAYVIIYIFMIANVLGQTRLQTRKISEGIAFEPQVCAVLQLDTAARHSVAISANYVVSGFSKNYFSKNMITSTIGYSYYFSPRIYGCLNYNLRYLPLLSSNNTNYLRSCQVRLSLGHDGKIGKTDFIKNFSAEYCISESKYTGLFFKLSTTLHRRFSSKFGSSIGMEAGIFKHSAENNILDQTAARTFSLSRFRFDVYYQISKNVQTGFYAQRHTAYFNVLALSDNPNIAAPNAYYPTNFVYTHVGVFMLIKIAKSRKNTNQNNYFKQQYRYLYAQPEFLFF